MVAGSGVSYELPERSFAATAVASAANRCVRETPLRASVAASGVRFGFPAVTGAATRLAVTNMGGRLVASVPLAKSTEALELNGRNGSGPRLAPGCYMASLVETGRTVSSCIFTIAGN